MIPKIEDNIINEFTDDIEPSLTYRLDIDSSTISGMIDEKEALKQTIYKALNTERYLYDIYSDNYGIEIEDLIGRPYDYVCAELKRVIEEALTEDDRVLNVDNFNFSRNYKKGSLHVGFVVSTIYGEEEIEQEVNL